MDSSLDAVLLPPTKVARMTNMEIVSGLPTTRKGVRIHSLAGTGLEDRAVQGASFYNPSKGLSQRTFADDRSSIIVSAGGDRFQLKADAHHAIKSAITVAQIGELQGDTRALLAWVAQAEDYIIITDGESDTWFWNSVDDPENSTGYISDGDRENSMIPNGATAFAYAHGRIIIVVNGSQTLIGDIIHKTDRSNSRNILEFTEQTYLETGGFLSPPSALGGINVIAILPQQNTLHGSADVMEHCEDGVFSADINRAPRSSWSETPLTRHVLLQTGATGPYALVLVDGDQIFRSRHGVQTLRSAAAESTRLGNPLHPISEPVADWLLADHLPFLRFCSMVKSAIKRRLYCTTGLWVEGAYRGGRGVVALNFASIPNESRPAWEGLHVMPPEAGSVVQMINGIFNGNDRTFAFCTRKNDDGEYVNTVTEFTDETDDILEDGSRKKISAQLISGESYGESSPFTQKQFGNGSLFLKGVKGSLKWGVWCRESQNGRWVFWRGGTADPVIKNTDDRRLQRMAVAAPRDVTLPLGEVPEPVRTGRKMQLMLRVLGHCQVEGLKVGYRVIDQEEAKSESGQDITETAQQTADEYSDYEYLDEVNRWEEDERINRQ